MSVQCPVKLVGYLETLIGSGNYAQRVQDAETELALQDTKLDELENLRDRCYASAYLASGHTHLYTVGFMLPVLV